MFVHIRTYSQHMKIPRLNATLIRKRFKNAAVDKDTNFFFS